MHHGKSLYFNDEESQMYMNVLQLKGPYIMHKFRTSHYVHLEVDPQIRVPNITFDGNKLKRQFRISMRVDPFSQDQVDLQKYEIDKHIVYLTVIMVAILFYQLRSLEKFINDDFSDNLDQT